MEINVEKIEIMNVQPGDSLVITLSKSLSHAEVDKLHEVLRTWYPKCTIVVLEKGSKIQIVRGLD